MKEKIRRINNTFGFKNDTKAKEALKITKGNVEEAIRNIMMESVKK